MRRTAVLATVLVLLGSLPITSGAGASPQGAAAGWRETLTINSALGHPAKMFEAFDTASLNLYDFNGDGQLEIVSNNDNNRAYVLDSKSGGVLAELPTSHPGGEKWPVRDINPIAIGNLMGDGVPCMVVPSDAAKLTAWCYNAGNSTPTHFDFTKMWDVTINAQVYEPNFNASHPWLFYPSNGTKMPQYSIGSDGDAFMASVDGTGCKYVFAETDGWPGQLAFDCHGNYKWSVSYFDGNAGATVVDLDHDGRKEACFASDGGEIACYDAKTGSTRWTFHARDHGAYPGSVPLAPAFADVYGDGKLYTFFGARNAVYSATQHDPPSAKSPGFNPNWMNETHAVWYLLDSKGAMVWNVSYDWMNPVQYNHPAAIDVNGDGVLDFVALDWNTIGHKPGDWEPTNRSSNLFALDGRDGSVLWRTSVPIYWSNKDFVIADADGDGKQEVISIEPKFGYDGIGAYDLATGKEKGWFPFTDGWGTNRGPVAGDLYGDGQIYLVVPAAHHLSQPNYRSLDVGYREGELHVISTGAAWNVKFSANLLLNDDQKGDAHGTGGSPPTRPGAPQGLNATLDAGGVTLSWSAPASNGGAKILSYNVYRDGQNVATANGTTWTDAGAATGSYSYAVKAVNAAGEGDASTAVGVTVPPPVTSTPPTVTTTPPPTGATTTSPPPTTTTATTPTTTTGTTTTPTESISTPPQAGNSRVPLPGLAVILLAVGAAAATLRKRR